MPHASVPLSPSNPPSSHASTQAVIRRPKALPGRITATCALTVSSELFALSEKRFSYAINAQVPRPVPVRVRAHSQVLGHTIIDINFLGC